MDLQDPRGVDFYLRRLLSGHECYRNRFHLSECDLCCRCKVIRVANHVFFHCEKWKPYTNRHRWKWALCWKVEKTSHGCYTSNCGRTKDETGWIMAANSQWRSVSLLLEVMLMRFRELDCLEEEVSDSRNLTIIFRMSMKIYPSLVWIKESVHVCGFELLGLLLINSDNAHRI